MKDWPRPGIFALLHELYQLNDENRRFLHARLLEDHAEQTLNDTKRQLKRMLSVNAIYRDEFRHAEVKDRSINMPRLAMIRGRLPTY